MSPRWRDEVALYASPRRVAVSRIKRGMRPMRAAESSRAVEGGETNQWEAALRTLQSLLEDPRWHRAVCRVVLSNHWARYVVVPWSDALSDGSERLQHARHCMSKTYGDAVTQWTARLTDSPPGAPQVACAIPTDLLDGVLALSEARGLRVKSVQPQLIASFNAWRRRLAAGAAWFVSVEEGSLAAAHFTPSGWDQVRSVRIGNDWEVELKRLHTFTRLAGSSAEEARVYVDAPPGIRATAGASEAAFDWLDDDATDSAASERLSLLQRMYA